MPDDVEPPPEPEPEPTEINLEARVAALESQLAALSADFAAHEHVDIYATVDHEHSEPEREPPAPADEQPRAGKFWFRKIGE